MTSASEGVVTSAGRELARLTFVEQELRRLQARDLLPANLFQDLSAAYQTRRLTLYHKLLNTFARQGNWRAVCVIAQAALRFAPDEPEFHGQLGLALAHLDDEAAAFTALRRAVVLGAQSVEVLNQLEQLYQARGMRAEATLTLQAVIALQPWHVPARERIADLTRQEWNEAVDAQQAAPAKPDRELSDTRDRLDYLQQFLERSLPANKLPADLRQQLADRQQALSPQAATPLPTPTVPAAPPAPVVPQQATTQAPPPPARSPRAPFDWANFWNSLLSERMLRALLYLGATLLVASACIWMAFNWNRFAAPVQFGVLTGITSTFYGCGYLLRSKLKLLRSGSTLIAIGAGWIAVVGWAIANLAGIGPPQTWLLISALCLPAYLATSIWLREELFSALTALAAINLLLAGLHLADVTLPWRANALLLLLAAFVAVTHPLRALSDGRRLAGPLIWIAQALVPLVLLGSAIGLRWSLWPTPFDQMLLALVWWLGAGFYLLSLRVSGGIGYEQAVAWVTPAALVFSVEATGILPTAWHGVLLLAITPIYLWVAPRRRAAYVATQHPCLNYPFLWPTYGTAYLLSLLALVWPSSTLTALLTSSIGAAGLYIASARIFGHAVWAWLASGAGLLAGWHLTRILALTDADKLVLTAAIYGVGYWLVGVVLERAPRYARAPLAFGYTLLAGALLFGFGVSLATQRLIFPIIMVACLASGWLAHRGRLAAVVQVISAWRKRPSAPVVTLSSFAIVAALLPVWLALVAPGLPLYLIGLAQLALAGGYIAVSRWFVSSQAPRLRQMLLGMAMMLTLLPFVPFFSTAPAIPFALLLAGWGIAALPLWDERGHISIRYATTTISGDRLDLLALAGGLAALPLTNVQWLERPTLLTLTLAAAGVYLFATLLYRRAAGLSMVGGLSLSAWLTAMQWLALPFPAWGAWLAPLALLFTAAGLILERRAALTVALPAYLYGAATAIGSFGWVLSFYSSGTLSPAALSQGAVAIGALTSLAAVATMRFRREWLALLTGLLPIAAYWLWLGAAAVPIEQYGLAIMRLALGYFALALLNQRGWLARLNPFRTALLRCGYGLTVISLLGGGVAALGGDSATAALIALLFAANYTLAAFVLRRPLFVGVAALLVPAGVALAYDGFRTFWMPPTAQALLWLLLAAVYIELAAHLRRIPESYRRQLYAPAFGMTVLASGWTLNDRPMLLAALAGVIFLCLRWDWLSQPGKLAPLAAVGPRSWRDATTHQVTTIFLYPVAALTPLWVGLLLDLYQFDWVAIGLGLVLVAPIWLLVGRWLQRPGAARPFHLVGCALPVLALLVAGAWLYAILSLCSVGLYLGVVTVRRRLGWLATLILATPCIFILTTAHVILAIVHFWLADQNPFSMLFGYAAVVYAALAYWQRRPFWVIPAAFATLTAAFLGILEFVFAMQPHLGLIVELPAVVYDTIAQPSLALTAGLLTLAYVKFWLARGIDRRHLALQAAPIVAPWSAYTPPLYTTAALSAAIALTSAVRWHLSPSDQPAIPWMLAVVCFYLLCARRFYDPRWLYAVVIAVAVTCQATVSTLVIDPAWRGVAMLPVVFVAFGSGQWLHQRTWRGSDGHNRGRLIDPGQGIAWALPFYLLTGGSILGAVLRSSAPWPLALTLAGATLLSAWITLRWRVRGWLAVTLLVGHMAYWATLRALPASPSLDGLLHALLPLVALLVGAGLWAERCGQVPATTTSGHRRSPALLRLLMPSWAQPFYIAAALDMSLTLLLALTPLVTAGTTAIVVWCYAVLLAILVTYWRDNRLALSVPMLAVIGTDSLLRQIGSELDGRLIALAVQGLGLWWIGQGLRLLAARAGRGTTLADVWHTPLQWWGQATNLLAILLALGLSVVTWHPLALSRVLSIAGLFYLGRALRERRLRLSYLGSGMLVSAWLLTVLDALPTQPQIYAIPTGIYLLAIGAAERQRGTSRRVVQVIELLGMHVLLVVSFWQSLPSDFGYGMLLGLQALLIIIWGALQRVRLLFFGGIIAFILNLAVQSLGPIQATDKALLTFGVGLFLIIAAVYVERRRDYLRERARFLLAQLETWY